MNKSRSSLTIEIPNNFINYYNNNLKCTIVSEILAQNYSLNFSNYNF